MAKLEALTVEEMGGLIPQANEVLEGGLAALAMRPGQALWLINAGLSELRRSGAAAPEPSRGESEWTLAFMAAEFGFKAHERGLNLEAALAEFRKLANG